MQEQGHCCVLVILYLQGPEQYLAHRYSTKIKEEEALGFLGKHSSWVSAEGV